jgi:hypothetical protein
VRRRGAHGASISKPKVVAQQRLAAGAYPRNVSDISDRVSDWRLTFAYEALRTLSLFELDERDLLVVGLQRLRVGS